MVAMTREDAVQVIARYIVGYLDGRAQRQTWAGVPEQEWDAICATVAGLSTPSGADLDAELAVLVTTMAGAFDPQLRQQELDDAYDLLCGRAQ